MRRTLPATIAIAGLLMFILSSQGQAQAQGADDPAQVAAGQVVYEMSCAGCHGLDGSGETGPGRPLIGIADQGDRQTHIDSVTNGKGIMPAHGDQLSAEEIEQAVSYVRLTFVSDTAEAAEEAELALTGVDSTSLAVVGVALLAGGLQLVIWGRRND